MPTTSTLFVEGVKVGKVFGYWMRSMGVEKLKVGRSRCQTYSM